MTNILDTLRQMFPRGRILGNEYLINSFDGQPGEGIHISLTNGSWMAFTEGKVGNNLYELYAAVHKIPLAEAQAKLGNGHAPEPAPEPAPAPEAYDEPAEPQEPPSTVTAALPSVAAPTVDRWCCECSKRLPEGHIGDFCGPECYDHRQLADVAASEREIEVQAAHDEAVAVEKAKRKADPSGYEDAYQQHIQPAKPKPRPVQQPAAMQQMAASGGSSGELVPAVSPYVAQHKGRGGGKPALTVIEGGKAVAAKSRILRWDEMGLMVTEKGYPVNNVSNVEQIITHAEELQGRFWFDDFYRRMFTDWNGVQREVTDADILHLTVHLQRTYDVARFGDDLVRKGVTSYAFRHMRDSARDWMDSLVWDGVPRIEGFMHTTCGADESTYTLDVSRLFWLSMVARVMTPGVKFDEMIILEGAQGTYKTTMLSVIGGDWYKVPSAEMGSKDFLLGLGGCLVMEFGELTDFNKVDARTIKRILSTPVDYYRPPFERNDKKHLRQCVFIGTTNEHRYLRDSTGNRRFLPVQCGIIDIDRVRAERDQLFAESVATWCEVTENGHRRDAWYRDPAGAKEHQAMRMQYDSWKDTIGEWIKGKQETSISDVAANCLNLDISKQDVRNQHRIGDALAQLGWYSKQIRRDGRKPTVWRSPNYQPQLGETD